MTKTKAITAVVQWKLQINKTKVISFSGHLVNPAPDQALGERLHDQQLDLREASCQEDEEDDGLCLAISNKG